MNGTNYSQIFLQLPPGKLSLCFSVQNLWGVFLESRSSNPNRISDPAIGLNQDPDPGFAESGTDLDPVPNQEFLDKNLKKLKKYVDKKPVLRIRGLRIRIRSDRHHFTGSRTGRESNPGPADPDLYPFKSNIWMNNIIFQKIPIRSQKLLLKHIFEGIKYSDVLFLSCFKMFSVFFILCYRVLLLNVFL